MKQPRLPMARRRLLQAATASTAWRSLGTLIHAGLLPTASVAAQAAPTDDLLAKLGKPQLHLLNDRPLNAETPAHLLDDAITPANRFFVRNNGIMPTAAVDPDAWTLRVSGEACAKPTTFSLAELKDRFPSVTLQLQLECGGNGRAEFRPRASGNQWSTGAIACPQWTGIRLEDVLKHCGATNQAVYVAYKGADTHLSGDASKDPISRGVPIAKAREAEALLAYQMNGEPIPLLHGAPLRLVIGGWPGSVSGKWLTDILIRDRVHDGAKMTGNAYRVPCDPVAPGAKVAAEDMCIIESMPVKSLITFPQSGVQVAKGTELELRGHAWAGDRSVKRVDISTDFGATWQKAKLDRPVNRLAWQRFHAQVALPDAGYYEIWAKATDSAGVAQPMLVPGWNPKGYLNNACHRIAVQAV